MWNRCASPCSQPAFMNFLTRVFLTFFAILDFSTLSTRQMAKNEQKFSHNKIDYLSNTICRIFNWRYNQCVWLCYFCHLSTNGGSFPPSYIPSTFILVCLKNPPPTIIGGESCISQLFLTFFSIKVTFYQFS